MTGRHASDTCECGGAKDRRAKRCDQCYRRRWTVDRDDELKRLFNANWPYKKIGEAIGRSETSVCQRAKVLGLSRKWGTVHRSNLAAAVRDFFSNPANLRRWLEGHSRSETRAKQSENARRRNLDRTFGVTAHSDMTKKKIGATHRRKADARLGFAPRGHPLRKLYEHLILVKQFSAKEALAIVAEEIARMSPFERQMLRVQAGATVLDTKAAGEFEI